MKADVAAPRQAKPNATTAQAKAGKAAADPPERPAISSGARYDMIATAAYFRAEQRGFTGGAELEDWLAAEAEIDGAGGNPSRS